MREDFPKTAATTTTLTSNTWTDLLTISPDKAVSPGDPLVLNVVTIAGSGSIELKLQGKANGGSFVDVFTSDQFDKIVRYDTEYPILAGNTRVLYVPLGGPLVSWKVQGKIADNSVGSSVPVSVTASL